MIDKIKNIIALFEALTVALDNKDWQDIGRCEQRMRRALNELLIFAGGSK